MALMYYESSDTLILQIAFGCGSLAQASWWGGVQISVPVLILQESEGRDAQISGLPSLTLPEGCSSTADNPSSPPIWTTF